MIKLKVNGKGRPFDGAPEMPLLFVMLSQPPTELAEPALPRILPAIANTVFTATGECIRTMPMTKQGCSFA